MAEKWTKARCERELKDPANWKITYTGEFIQEKQFKFYTLRFVRYEIKAAIADWKSITVGPEGMILQGEWRDLGKTFVRTVADDGSYALRDISKPEAVEWMMEAVKKEGFKV